jgi:hypothetical protein
MGKRKFSCTVGDNVNYYNFGGKQSDNLLKIKLIDWLAMT